MRSLTCLLAPAFFLLALPASAQQRPLVTEDPETIGSGRMLVEAGIDYGRDVLFPASGLNGNLLRFPIVGISTGISSIAEIQIDGALFQRLSITDRRPAALSHMLTVSGDSTSGIDDAVVATKLRLLSEGAKRPAIGMRFGTKLPNASNEDGLGLDTIDTFGTLLVAKTVRSVRIVGNVGLLILGDPTRGDRQNDEVGYGLSFARALTNATEVVGEVNGRLETRAGEPPPGTESRSMLRFGGRYTHGMLRLDAALAIGLTAQDPGIGFTTGFTYVFDAFKIP
jgi:hypothetical protein